MIAKTKVRLYEGTSCDWEGYEGKLGSCASCGSTYSTCPVCGKKTKEAERG